ncbi:hypothetical protein J2S15_004087 [Breznakia pachnodae]|uniref:Uncharacterized protein n=1 Tax=Breznakia pachnodae TaxID=265178 RepID=A0ABU0E8X3_9FIRM|nr:hypothetical protein [Breznakia pachnodae]
MNNYLGYESNNNDYKNTANRLNGYGKKTLRITKGRVESGYRSAKRLGCII